MPDPCLVRFDVDRPLGAVSPWLYGHFSEHLHRVIYGGIWAELLENRKFELPGLHSRLSEVAPGWEAIAPQGVTLRRGDRELALPGRDAHHQQIVSFAGARPGGEGGIAQTGLALDSGCAYSARICLSSHGSIEQLRVRVGDAVVEVPVPEAAAAGWDGAVPGEGVVVSATLEPSLTTEDGVFSVIADPDGPAELWVHWISLLPADSLDGLYAGLVELFRDLPANIVKYPGGCFADSYDWRLGIGSRDDRHGAPDYAWGTWDENDFGTDEFLRWCELTGTTPYLCVNHGTGTPELAAAWVEYCNGAATTRWGARRAANGRAEPYGVKLWAIGNEVYGSWERGHTDAASYAAAVREFAAAMKEVDPELELVAQGDLGEYSRRVLELVGDVVDYLSVHHYSRHFEQPLAPGEAEAYVAEGRGFEAALAPVVAAIAETPGAGHVRIALDEWGWASSAQGLAGAAFTASVLNACARLAPAVAIGGHCCLVNPGSVVERIGQRLVPNLQLDVFRLFNRFHRTTVVQAESSSEALDVSAYADDAGASLVLVNAGAAELAVKVTGFDAGDTLECRRIEASGTTLFQHEAADALVVQPFEIVGLRSTRR